METFLRFYSGGNLVCQVCVWRQLQVCYTRAGKPACRWVLVKSSVALHGVGATLGSCGEINLWLWSCKSAPSWVWQLKRYIALSRTLGTGHGYLAFLHCQGTPGLLSLMQLGRFFWSGLCLGCYLRGFYMCVSELSNCWCWCRLENSVMMQ